MEAGALAFLKRTVAVAQAARPKTKWAIDGYVSCGDSMDDYRGVAQGRCPTSAKLGNDKLQSLLAMQDIVVPMSYLLSLNASFNEGYLRAVFAESARVAPGKPIYCEWPSLGFACTRASASGIEGPWTYPNTALVSAAADHAWYEYLLQGAPTVPQKPECAHATNGDYAPTCLLSRENLDVMLQVPNSAGVKGTVIWGGGADQGTAELCKSFRTYFFDTLGPAIASALAGSSQPPAPSPPPLLPRQILPPVQGGDPGPIMDRV
eukprot:SAG31_NODE_1215_length_9335_cov_5.846470_9_plen_263_part_00